jgi:putative holliday junction resolvase
MRILGIDYGLARIGVALSDPSGFLAQGLTVVRRTTDEAAASEIAVLATSNEVKHIVVGLPRNMDGTIGDRARACQAFADLIRQQTDIDVTMYDERLTTVAAERTLIAQGVKRAKRKQVIDAVAATIMLQSYLDAQKPKIEDDFVFD